MRRAPGRKFRAIWWLLWACALHVSCTGPASVGNAAGQSAQRAREPRRNNAHSRGPHVPDVILLQEDWPDLETWFEGEARPVATLAPDQPLASLLLDKAAISFQGAAGKPGTPRAILASLGDSGASGDTKPRGYLVPGRNPKSLMPWEFFLGHAAHRLIAYMYGVDHPDRMIFYNKDPLVKIVEEAGLGDAALLLSGEELLRPDITDINIRRLFEIKPENDEGLQEGRLQVQTYLTALNRVVSPVRRFSGGTNFTGSTHILFGDGCQVWRLKWHTPEPGIILYHWMKTRRCFSTAAEAYAAGEWVEITVDDMMVYGGWVAKAVEGMVWRRETLAAFSERVGIVVEVAGTGAVAFFSEAILGRLLPQSPAGRPPMQPPTQGGGKVLPFPSRKPPPPVELPKASGM